MSYTLFTILDLLGMLCHAIGIAMLLVICFIIGYNIGIWAAKKLKGEDDESEQ